MSKTQKYIVRSADAGVFYGEIAERRGSEVDMVNVRRIFRWSGASDTLQLALDGVSNPKETRMTVAVSSMTILGVCQINPCSDAATEILDGIPVWKY